MIVGKVITGFVYRGEQFPPDTIITSLPLEDLYKFSRMGYVLLIEEESNVNEMVKGISNTPRFNKVD